jgi:hypothetical protein
LKDVIIHVCMPPGVDSSRLICQCWLCSEFGLVIRPRGCRVAKMAVVLVGRYILHGRGDAYNYLTIYIWKREFEEQLLNVYWRPRVY